MRKLYAFMGSKSRHIKFLNEIICYSKSKNYCEPFLGSGVVFLNLCRDFAVHYLNDLQKENLLAFKYAKDLDREKIESVFNNYLEKYPLEDKEVFYDLRNNVYNKMGGGIDKTVLTFRFYQACINAIVRFNKDGSFSSSFGRGHQMGYNNYRRRMNEYIESIEYIKTKNIKVTNQSFENCLNHKDCLYFIDPPYTTNAMALQKGFNENDLQVLVDFMLITENEFIYTDTLNEVNKPLLEKFNYSTLEKIGSVSPSTNRVGEKLQEIVVWNFKQKSIFD